jgi:hypothetical protein
MPEATGQLALEQTTCHEVVHSQSPCAPEILSLFLAGWRATLRIMILDPRSRLDRNSYSASADVDSNSAPSLLSGASHSTHRWKGLDRRHHSVCGVAHLTASGVKDGVCYRNAVDLFFPWPNQGVAADYSGRVRVMNEYMNMRFCTLYGIWLTMVGRHHFLGSL